MKLITVCVSQTLRRLESFIIIKIIRKGESKMKMFRKEDLRPDYLILMSDGDLYRVVYTRCEGRIGVSQYGTFEINLLDDNLRLDDGNEVLEIFGKVQGNRAYKRATFNRELLWEREDT
jgi:hypothetical protein